MRPIFPQHRFFKRCLCVKIHIQCSQGQGCAVSQASEKMSHVMQNVHSAPTADNPHEYRVVAPQGATVSIRLAQVLLRFDQLAEGCTSSQHLVAVKTEIRG